MFIPIPILIHNTHEDYNRMGIGKCISIGSTLGGVQILHKHIKGVGGRIYNDDNLCAIKLWIKFRTFLNESILMFACFLF